ncbi:MAG: FtsX-like permease family protein [Oscillospiraceae bacterium]|nr:FtsX-like permease family protein [Oscillospiraceae bacterium]
MKNILMLSLANVRKSKSQTVGLLVFVLIAAMFLNMGLVIFLGLEKFFDERAEANHMAHFTGIYYDGTVGLEQGLRFIESHPKVTETEQMSAVGGFGDYYIDAGKNFAVIMICPYSETQKMDAPSLVGDSLPLTDNAIYIPYFMYLIGGFEIGDEFKLFLQGTDLNFRVAGATEEIMFGAQFNSIHRFYVPNERYEELQKQFPDAGLTLLSVRLENIEDEVFFQADYNKEVSQEGLIFDLIYDNAKVGRTMTVIIATIIIVAFSIILLIVSLIVIRFRIVNSIEEGMTNIGALKAIGYKSVQIVSSIVLQFGLTALIGGVLGIALSQAAIPLVTQLLKPMYAFVWSPKLDIFIALGAVIFVLAAVVLVTLITAQRIGKLHPLIALRGGIKTHSFKKNPLPLEKSHGELTFLLAMKQLLRNKKQAFAILIIVAALSMASIVGVAVNYSMNQDKENFALSFFGEMPTLFVSLKSDSGGEEFLERILEYPEVRKAYGYNAGDNILIDETAILVNIVEDCSLLEGKMLISGRYPKHSNEIALGMSSIKVADKKIGDTVIVKRGETEAEFLITGTVQFISQGGFNGFITVDGMRRLNPDFKFSGFNIYLNSDAPVKEFTQKIEAAEGDIFGNITDIQEQIESMLTAMGGIFAIVAMGIVVVTVFVVILTLYMVIKTTIGRRKRELGIQKALGFTTLQLMNQIALNMTPIILIGVMCGAVAGYFGLNPMMAALMTGMGIVKSELPIPLGQTAAVCASLVAIAYVVSMLIAWRIRKISAYGLVSE